MRDGRRAREDRGSGELDRQPRITARRSGRGTSAEAAADRRARRSARSRPLVRVAAQRAGRQREVERERDADDGDARLQRPLELDGARPALRAARLEQRVRFPAARSASAPAAASSTAGAAVEHRLGGRHDDDEVGLDERGADPQRRGRSRPVPRALRRGRSAARGSGGRNSGRTSCPISRGAGTPLQPARDEDRLPLERDARRARAPRRRRRSRLARGSCVAPGIGSAGGSTTIVARPPGVASPLQRLAGEREAQRLRAPPPGCRRSAAVGGGGRSTSRSAGRSRPGAAGPRAAGRGP